MTLRFAAAPGFFIVCCGLRNRDRRGRRPRRLPFRLQAPASSTARVPAVRSCLRFRLPMRGVEPERTGFASDAAPCDAKCDCLHAGRRSRLLRRETRLPARRAGAIFFARETKKSEKKLLQIRRFCAKINVYKCESGSFCLFFGTRERENHKGWLPPGMAATRYVNHPEKGSFRRRLGWTAGAVDGLNTEVGIQNVVADDHIGHDRRGRYTRRGRESSHGSIFRGEEQNSSFGRGVLRRARHGRCGQRPLRSEERFCMATRDS